jgi:hypothetical protein
MRNTIQGFWATYLLDLRLTCLHWGYLLFLVVWSGFIIVTYTRDDYESIQGLFNIVLGFIGLVGMFLTGIQASRAQRNRFDMLEVALPSGVEVLLARWLAVITTLGGLVIAPLFVVITAPAGRLDPSYVLNNLLLILVSTAFATGLIWLVQNTVGIRRWMYPLFGVLWLAGGMLPNMLNNDGLPLPGINLFNFITMNQSINSPLWGQLSQGQLTDLTVLFYVGIVMLFAGVMLWRTTAARFHRRSPIIITLTAAALGVILFAGSSYTVQVYAANQQVLAEDQHQQAYADYITQPAGMPFEATAYNVTFALGTPSQLSAQMDVLNRSDAPLTELIFSLYHQFEITDASVQFARERDILTLTLPQALAPGESTQIRVMYQGNIAYLERRLGRPPEATYFIRPEGVNLACAVLWYPVPGQLLPNFTQYDDNFQAIPACPLDHPTAFRLTIDAPGTLSYVSNLTWIDATTFVSEGTTWVQLIGAPSLQTITDGALTLVTTSEQFERLHPQINRYYIPAFEYLQRFFPEAQHLTVLALELAADSWSQWAAYPATQESLVAFISPQRFDFLTSGTESEYRNIGVPLISSLFGGRDNPLTENIAYFLWMHYKSNGDMTQMQALLENGLPSGGGMSFYFALSYEERYQIAFALYDIYSTHGETAVIDLLHEMRAQIDTLGGMSAEQMATWIEETVDAD